MSDFFPVLYQSIATGPAGSSAPAGVLDGIATSANHAWDIYHLLTGNYDGPLIRVREDGGGTEQDIGFDGNGLLDTTALTTFLSGANGFLVKVYDQVGSVDAGQATTTKQPAYSATAFNSQPGGDFNGTSHYLSANGAAAAFSGTDKALTTLCAVAWDDIDANGKAWSFRWTVGSSPLFLLDANGNSFRLWRRDNSSAGTADTISAGDTNPHVHTTRFTGTAYDHWVDNTQALTAEGADVGDCTFNTFTIGGTVTTSESAWINGKIAGQIMFASAVDESQLATLRAAYVALKGTA